MKQTRNLEDLLRQYDLLADAVRQGLDMDYVYRVLHRKA